MSSKSLPPITKNALTRIFDGEPNLKPTLMVVSIQPPKNAQQQASVMIGDGARYTGAIISPLMLKGLKRNSVITLNHYFWTITNDRNVVVILDMTHHQEEGDTTSGNNESLTKQNRDPLRPGISRAKSASTKPSPGTVMSSKESLEQFKQQALKKSNSNESLSRKRSTSIDGTPKKRASLVVQPTEYNFDDDDDSNEKEKEKEKEKVSNLFSIATPSMESDIQKLNSLYEKKKDSSTLPHLKRTRSVGFYQSVIVDDKPDSSKLSVVNPKNDQSSSTNQNNNTTINEQTDLEQPTIRRTVSVDGAPQFKRVSSRTYLVSLPAIAEKQANSFSAVTKPRTAEINKKAEEQKTRSSSSLPTNNNSLEKGIEDTTERVIEKIPKSGFRSKSLSSVKTPKKKFFSFFSRSKK